MSIMYRYKYALASMIIWLTNVTVKTVNNSLRFRRLNNERLHFQMVRLSDTASEDELFFKPWAFNDPF